MESVNELYEWKCQKCGHKQVHDAKIVNKRCKCGYWMEWSKIDKFEYE